MQQSINNKVRLPIYPRKKSFSGCEDRSYPDVLISSIYGEGEKDKNNQAIE